MNHNLPGERAVSGTVIDSNARFNEQLLFEFASESHKAVGFVIYQVNARIRPLDALARCSTVECVIRALGGGHRWLHNEGARARGDLPQT